MKRPSRLVLDHFASDRRAVRGGWLLFAAGVAIAGVLGGWGNSLRAQRDAIEDQAALVTRTAAPARAPATLDPRRLEEAERRARLVAQELSLPWSDLFDAVEAAIDPSVALLAIEPDARRAAVRVTGEARSKQAMLDYMTRLGAQKPIVRVLLESHTDRGGARAPVQFTVIAHWEGHR